MMIVIAADLAMIHTALLGFSQLGSFSRFLALSKVGI